MRNTQNQDSIIQHSFNANVRKYFIHLHQNFRIDIWQTSQTWMGGDDQSDILRSFKGRSYINDLFWEQIAKCLIRVNSLNWRSTTNWNTHVRCSVYICQKFREFPSSTVILELGGSCSLQQASISSRVSLRSLGGHTARPDGLHAIALPGISTVVASSSSVVSLNN